MRAALDAFGARPYVQVSVAELAAAAATTTGPLYHHFGSKLGLYTTVREDVERRVVDRMAGVLAAIDGHDESAPIVALSVAFDFATRAGFAAMLADRHPDRAGDVITDVLADAIGSAQRPLAELLTAAWRAALTMVVDGRGPDAARAAFTRLSIRPPSLP